MTEPATPPPPAATAPEPGPTRPPGTDLSPAPASGPLVPAAAAVGSRGTGLARLAGAVTAAAVAALTAVVLALTQLDVIAPPLWVEVAAVAVSATLAFVSTTAAAVGTRRRQQAAALHDRVSFVLRTLGYTVQDLTDLDTRELGLALHVVRTDHWPPPALLAALPGGRPPVLRLVRLVRERAARRPSASGVVWRPGKGVIGLCAATGEVVGQDVAADTGPWVGVPAADWGRVPPEVRDGFTWAEFTALAGRYDSVLAAPVIDDSGAQSRVVGCVSLDGPAESFELLWTTDVRAALAQAAQTLAVLVL